jgi:hypothetical protein
MAFLFHWLMWGFGNKLALLSIALVFVFGTGIFGCARNDGTLRITIRENAPAPPLHVISENPTHTQTPPLFRLWTATDNTYQVDFRECAIDETHTASLTVITGERCSCQLLVKGSEASGTMTFSNCSSSTCQNLAGTFTFENKSEGLKICKASSCISLK